MQVKDLGEFELIARLTPKRSSQSGWVIHGVGDDTAVLRASSELILITTDTFVEGVHFTREFVPFRDLGWRLLAANLSDIAAMGGLPTSAVINLTIPNDTEVKSIDELYSGLMELAQHFDTEIVGGDTTVSPDRIVLSMTVLGQVEKDKIKLRSGAKVGDAVFVTGNPGSAHAGLQVLKSPNFARVRNFSGSVEKHRRPIPRIREARFLAEHFSIHSLIDISDGLASEAGHLCRQSRVGMELEEKAIPIHPEVAAVAELKKETPLHFALSGGEDFELLFTAAADRTNALTQQFSQKFGFECTRIGRVLEEKEGLLLKNANGSRTRLTQTGYEHFR